jgi:hypothetical protein
MAKEWTRSATLALASHNCAQCHGLGLRGTTFDIPCDCVLRSIFRICYERFHEYATSDRHLGRITLEVHNGPDRRVTWGRKEEEYMADFILLAKRTLDEDEYRMFRLRYMLGADWQLCARKLKLDRGTYFNRVYSVQKKLGRAFAELEPYPLFPLSEYFHSSHRDDYVHAFVPLSPKVVPIRPPVKSDSDDVADLDTRSRKSA